MSQFREKILKAFYKNYNNGFFYNFAFFVLRLSYVSSLANFSFNNMSFYAADIPAIEICFLYLYAQPTNSMTLRMM